MKNLLRIFSPIIMSIACAGSAQAQWTRVPLPDSPRCPFAFVSMGSYLFAGTNIGIYVTKDSTKTWTSASNGLTSTYVKAMTCSGTMLFAGTSYPSSPGVYASSDSGASWTSRSSGLPGADIYALASMDTDIFAGTFGNGVFHSQDRGATWSAANNGLSNLNVWCFDVSGQSIYAGTYDGGIFRSDDRGNSWNALACSGLSGNSSTNLFVDGSRIYNGTWANGMYLSTDSGAHFTAINNGLTTTAINGIAVIPKPGGGYKLFTGGAMNKGIFLSADSGASWSTINSGFDTTRYIYTVGAFDGYMLIGANTKEDVAFWKRPISDVVTSVDRPMETMPRQFSLGQNYPNPFNPTTTITFTLAKDGFTTLKIYDMLGREVATLVNGDRKAGVVNAVTFNASKLSSGVYFYKLTAGNYSNTRKLILMK
jgi:photosystem II stability/assembly factor-like uncharacterized protein